MSFHHEYDDDAKIERYERRRAEMLQEIIITLACWIHFKPCCKFWYFKVGAFGNETHYGRLTGITLDGSYAIIEISPEESVTVRLSRKDYTHYLPKGGSVKVSGVYLPVWLQTEIEL